MKTRNVLTLVFSLVVAMSAAAKAGDGWAPASDMLDTADIARLNEAKRLASAHANGIWPGWEATPFRIDLLTSKREILIEAPPPAADLKFRADGPVYTRPLTFPADLEATFELDGPTIVIGTPKTVAARTSTDWVITLMHEHFHQLQQFEPTYYTRVKALDLSHGDNTGMWMLNYPFPYKSPTVNAAFHALQQRLLVALKTRGTRAFPEALERYLVARTEFEHTLSAGDYRYFNFQVWMEGVARYTEYRVALAAAHDAATGPYASLKDVTPYGSAAARILHGVQNRVENLTLSGSGRVCFYSVGAGEALLLDEISSDWHQRYLSGPMDLSVYFKASHHYTSPIFRSRSTQVRM